MDNKQRVEEYLGSVHKLFAMYEIQLQEFNEGVVIHFPPHNMTEQILSNPEYPLALIVEGKLPRCINRENYEALKNAGFTHSVVPLSEYFKAVTE